MDDYTQMSSTPILSDENIRKILRGITVPPQPQVIVDIVMEQAMPNPDLHRISGLISQDVGLAGALLKVVNSNLFAPKEYMASIEQAVQMLGLASIMRITEGLSVKSQMSDEAIVALGGFWDSATEIACIAAIIAKDIGYEAPEKAYCLGLFHNCGVPLLYKAHANYGDVIVESYSHIDDRIIDTENRLLKTNHAVVGYFVAKSWGLPQDLCEAIAEHHSVATAFNEQADGGSSKKTLLAILKMAEHICHLHKTLGQTNDDFEWANIAKEVLYYVGFSEMDFDDLSSRLENTGISSNGFYDLS